MISHANGGQMTNSPPSNVKTGLVSTRERIPCEPLGPDEAARVLVTGIDTLNFSMQANFPTTELHDTLASLKAEAQDNDKPLPAVIMMSDGTEDYRFEVRPNGGRGIEYIIGNDLMVLCFGRSPRAKGTRPNIMAELKSESLWHHGVDNLVSRVFMILREFDAELLNIKPSRADLCCDILLRKSDWHERLRQGMVTRAQIIDPHFIRGRLSGFSIGRGKCSARLYDKPFEIACAGGKKVWFFDVWGIDQVPDGHVVIRVEFQLRREFMKERRIDTLRDLREKTPALWAYLTKRWLRLVDDASKHHTMQDVLPWWEVVQHARAEFQDAMPAVRREAIKADKTKLAQGLLGYAESYIAMMLENVDLKDGGDLDQESIYKMAVEDALRHVRRTPRETTNRIKRKQVKRQRASTNFKPHTGAPDHPTIESEDHQLSGHSS